MSGKKVLIVDDSETIRQQVATALEAAGFIVVEAQDGIEALECLDTHELNIVLLDINMPRLNGIDFLERMRQNPKHQDLPVVMLTTEAQQSVIERAKKAGAKGWMIKPVKMPQLVNAVARLAS